MLLAIENDHKPQHLKTAWKSMARTLILPCHKQNERGYQLYQPIQQNMAAPIIWQHE